MLFAGARRRLPILTEGKFELGLTGETTEDVPSSSACLSNSSNAPSASSRSPKYAGPWFVNFL